jgi:molybdopterin/thiamine biosynthesis adenylyltransferase
MVHGAIGGFFGQVMTIYPEDRGLELLYGPREKALNKGIEISLGNPSATPPMVASWQAQEVVKVITGIGSPLRNRVLYMDAKEGDVHIIKFQMNKEDI